MAADALGARRRRRAPAGRVAAAVLSAATRTGTRVSTTRPAEPSAAEDQAGAPRREPGGQRTGGGHAEQAAGVDEVVGGRVEARAAARPGGAGRSRRWRSSARRPRGRSGARRRPRRRRRLGRRRARARCRAPTSATGTSRRPHPTTMPMPVSRPRPTGPAASAYTPMPGHDPERDAEQPDAGRWRGRRGRRPAPLISRSTNVGGGARPSSLAGARLVAPAAGPLGRSHSAHNRTSSPTCHKATTPASRRICATRRRPHCRTVRRRTDRGGGQRRGWQVGQWVVPRASMTRAAELGAAAVAGLAGPAVAAELELVAAGLAVDGAVVAQGGAAVGDALLEHGAELDEQRGRPPAG